MSRGDFHSSLHTAITSPQPLHTINGGGFGGVCQVRWWGRLKRKKVVSSWRWEIAVAVGGLTPFRGHNGILEMPWRRPSCPLALVRGMWCRGPRGGAGKQHLWQKMVLGGRCLVKICQMTCRGGFYISLHHARIPPQPLHNISGSRCSGVHQVRWWDVSNDDGNVVMVGGVAVVIGWVAPFGWNNGILEMLWRRPSCPLVLGGRLWRQEPQGGAGKQL